MQGMSLRLIPFLVITALLSACASRDANRWHGTRNHEIFAVVFAPVDSTPIDAIWPDAAQQLAYDLANRVDILGRDADGWAAEGAPRSTATPVQIAGADWSVSTRVTSLDLGASPFGPQWVAKVEMRVVDAAGREVFRKSTHGTQIVDPSPKFMAPESRPEAKATWAACSEAVSALIEHLKLRNEIPLPAPVVVAPPIAGPENAQITIDSIPGHADVLIDGTFRGTTPLALTLPTKPVEIRIERQGRLPWVRTLTPEAGMQLTPALEEPVSAPAPTAPAAPAPAAAP